MFVNIIMLEHLSKQELDDLEFILNHPNNNDGVIMELYGSGFFGDTIKKLRNWLSPCLCYGKGTKKTIAEYGKYPIVAMQIYRTPLSNLINIALNGITFGKWYKLMEQFGFDEFFHLALVVTIKINGKNKNIVVEKNEVINVSTSYKTSSTTETYPVEMGSKSGITLQTLLDRTRNNVGDDRFYLYDAFNNNCQYFIRYILTTAGLYTKGAEGFLFQDINELANKLPSYIKKTARAITDIAGTTSKLIGKGKV